MKEIDPQSTSRATAFALWMQAPNPMVTLIKTLDVMPLIRLAERRKLKFNMLLDYCIGRAAAGIREFYMLPVNGKLMAYDTLAVNTIVKNEKGEINSCDILYTEDLAAFHREYLRETAQCARTCQNRDLPDSMVIGTSAVTNTQLDGAVGMYSGIFNNPFLIWGKYKRGLFKATLTISFQFHHTQMDGAEAGRFLENLQTEIRHLNV